MVKPVSSLWRVDYTQKKKEEMATPLKLQGKEEAAGGGCREERGELEEEERGRGRKKAGEMRGC